MPRKKLPLRTPTPCKIIEAESRGAYWLAETNAASEQGNHARAKRAYGKAQYWLDRYNKLTEAA